MAKPYYEFFCPVKVIAGHAALEHIPFELATLGAKRPLIITDKGYVPITCLHRLKLLLNRLMPKLQRFSMMYRQILV